MNTVLIASPNTVLCENIKAILDIKSDIYPFAGTGSYIDIEDSFNHFTPRFVVIDLISDYRGGLSLISSIKKNYRDVQIIAISDSIDQNKFFDVLRCGAQGYLMKEGLFNELYRCICTLLQGDFYVSQGLINLTLNHIVLTPQNDGERTFLLSPREKEHIAHIANGLNPKEIAYTMKISKKTVDNYRNRIMSKLNMNSVAEIVRYAIKEQIVSL